MTGVPGGTKAQQWDNVSAVTEKEKKMQRPAPGSS
jgi:hypothetical protein